MKTSLFVLPQRSIAAIVTGCIVLLFTNFVYAEKLILFAGSGTELGDGGPATEAKLSLPFGTVFDRAGNAFIVEMTGERVRKIDPWGTISTIAGTGKKGPAGDGKPAIEAEFNGIHNLAIDAEGNLYFADTWNNRVRKYSPSTGKITTVAGTGEKGFSGDGGPATQAKFGGIYCATLNAAGDKIYLADLDNKRIRAVDLKSGIVTTVAGNGQKGVPDDNATATTTPLVDPRAVAVDRTGNVYVLERGGHALRVVDTEGKIRTVVSGKGDAAADETPALSAGLKGPKHLCFDENDNVIIADSDNHSIRKYLPREGKVIRIAGSGKVGSAGLDGPAKECQLNQPHGVYLHADGTLYITDSHNHRVLKWVKE